MAKKGKQKEQTQAPEPRVADLTLPATDADKVKGGAVGPCFRPK